MALSYSEKRLLQEKVTLYTKVNRVFSQPGIAGPIIFQVYIPITKKSAVPNPVIFPESGIASPGKPGSVLGIAPSTTHNIRHPECIFCGTLFRNEIDTYHSCTITQGRLCDW
jgi:hypothetical protein